MMDKNDPKITPQHKQQYRVVLEINAPIEKCFAAGSAEEAMMYWVPGPKSIVYDQSKAAEPYGAGSQRVVTLNSGASMVEKIHISEKPTFIAYNIPTFGVGDLFLNNYVGHMNFEALGPSRTRLTWVGYFQCNGLKKITEPLVRMMMKNLITKMGTKLGEYCEIKKA